MHSGATLAWALFRGIITTFVTKRTMHINKHAQNYGEFKYAARLVLGMTSGLKEPPDPDYLLKTGKHSPPNNTAKYWMDLEPVLLVDVLETGVSFRSAWDKCAWDEVRGWIYDAVVRVGRGNRTAHYMEEPLSYSRISGTEYSLFSGQHKLVLIALLLCALKRRFRDDPRMDAERIDRLLFNAGSDGDARYKILPTKHRESFKDVLDGAETKEDDYITSSFEYFMEKVLDDGYDVVMHGIERLYVRILAWPTASDVENALT